MESYGICHVVAAAVIGYVVGSINFSIIVARLGGKGDIRNYFSKNAGTTNTYRLLGWRWALVVLCLDLGRGGLFLRLIGSRFEDVWVFLFVCTCLLIGNIFPLFHGFKGGKGVATSLGLMFGMNPLAALIAGGAWIAIVGLSGRASLGSFTATAVFPIVAILVDDPVAHWVLGGCMLLIILMTHHKNISRILSGNEPTLKK